MEVLIKLLLLNEFCSGKGKVVKEEFFWYVVLLCDWLVWRVIVFWLVLVDDLLNVFCCIFIKRWGYWDKWNRIIKWWWENFICFIFDLDIC